MTQRYGGLEETIKVSSVSVLPASLPSMQGA